VLLPLNLKALPAAAANAGDQRYLARLFVLAVHAEIEAYLETRALEIAQNVQADWLANRSVSISLISFLGFSGAQMEAPADRLNVARRQRVELDEKIRRAVSAYWNAVANTNHGIKEANLCAVLFPLGIGPADLDPLWIAEMENFGQLRGELAHQSVSNLAGSPSYQQAPRDLFHKAMFIYEGIRRLDARLDVLHGPAANRPTTLPHSGTWLGNRMRDMLRYCGL
jgi:hypothetical protein